MNYLKKKYNLQRRKNPKNFLDKWMNKIEKWGQNLDKEEEQLAKNKKIKKLKKKAIYKLKNKDFSKSNCAVFIFQIRRHILRVKFKTIKSFED